MITIPFILPDGSQLGCIEISCLEAHGRQPDSVNVYEAVFTNAGAPDRYIVAFTHRYGDHWSVLLRKAVEALAISHPQWKEK